jgi:hypothetical protein
MTELVPDNSKRIAYFIGFGLHPATIAIGTLLILLWGLPLSDTIRWTALVAGVILIPIFATTAYLQRQDQHTYQRLSRKPIYLVAWIDVAICLGLILIFNGPTILGICMATLLVWLPLQLGINQFVTKISIHMGVASGCFATLWIVGKLTPLLILVCIALLLLLAWARIQTKNHTIGQVVLGCVVGIGSVLLVFPFFPV